MLAAGEGSGRRTDILKAGIDTPSVLRLALQEALSETLDELKRPTTGDCPLGNYINGVDMYGPTKCLDHRTDRLELALRDGVRPRDQVLLFHKGQVEQHTVVSNCIEKFIWLFCECPFGYIEAIK